MDRIIKDNRRIKPKHYKYIALAIIFIAIIIIVLFQDNSSTLRIDKENITIEKAFKGKFQDYIQVTGVVEPISTVYLDAKESGIVEDILIEEGSMVKQGDVIVKMSNTNLNLSILNSEAQLAEKANFLRETQINIQQQKLELQKEILRLSHELQRKKRMHEQNNALYKDGLISKEEFTRTKEDYALANQLEAISRKKQIQDSIFRKNQITKIKANLNNMQKNLELIYQKQENLHIKTPVDGQLGMLDAELGQSISQGQRVGQINVLTSYKINAEIDEHYIDRIRKGLEAAFNRQEHEYQLAIYKVYPEVRNGRFKVDLKFTGSMPDHIRSGQSYHISLQLGVAKQALQIPRGVFFQETGGQWIFVIAKDGHSAFKKPISIGKQNPLYYEVLDGLKNGQKVITSSYELFGDYDKLVFK